MKLALIASLFLIALFSVPLIAQSNNGTVQGAKKANRRAPTPTPTPTPVEPLDDGEVIDTDDTITIETNLVSIPVRVTDRKGKFVPGLSKEDFSLFDDKKEREITYFSNEEMPFTVALVLDMSYSSKFKINDIQQAAYQFATELRPADKMMVVAFDEHFQILCEPTSDRKEINRAIYQTRIGSGTSLYETLDEVLSRRMQNVQGRKAVVLFSDGVDTTSRRTSDREVLRNAVEGESLVFSIHYDTYADVQAIKRGGVIVNDPSNLPSTPPAGGGSIPGSNNPLGFPLPTGTIGTGGAPPRSLPGDGTSLEDYKKAEEFMREISIRTGGSMYEATSNSSLASVFSKIASELREYYSLGFYPDEEDKTRKDGKPRKIRVKVNREKVSVRSRESYVLKGDDPEK
ncbi:MAG: VWA domain-containing protein [Pyrinomonadaceae bacterium]